MAIIAAISRQSQSVMSFRRLRRYPGSRIQKRGRLQADDRIEPLKAIFETLGVVCPRYT